jgi:hypothetical protein
MSPEDDRRLTELDARLCLTEHLLVQLYTIGMLSAGGSDPDRAVTELARQLKAGAMLEPAPQASDPGQAALWQGALESAADRFAALVRAQISVARGLRRGST